MSGAGGIGAGMKSDCSENRPPGDPQQLASWLAEAARIEARAWAEAGAREFRLTDGRLTARQAADRALYAFLSDSFRIPPPENPGRILMDGYDLPAVVRGRGEGRVVLEVSGFVHPPEGGEAVWSCRPDMQLQQTAGLVEKSGTRPERALHLARLAVHPETGQNQGRLEPGSMEAATDAESGLVWTPPGSDWAAAAAEVVEGWLSSSGVRVLVCGPAGEGVDAVLDAWAGLRSGSGSGLSGAVRFGRSAAAVPKEADWESLLANEQRPVSGRAEELHRLIRDLEDRIDQCRVSEEEWEKFGRLSRKFEQMRAEAALVEEEWARKKTDVDRLAAEWRAQRTRYARAQKAWVGREARTREAAADLRRAEEALRRAEEAISRERRDRENLQQKAWKVFGALSAQDEVCQDLPGREELIEQRVELEQKQESLRAELREMDFGSQSSRNEAAGAVLKRAPVVFAVLADMHELDRLGHLEFDRVMLVEYHLASAPEVFVAACAAREGVMLWGDAGAWQPYGAWARRGPARGPDLGELGLMQIGRGNASRETIVAMLPSAASTAAPEIVEAAAGLGYAASEPEVEVDGAATGWLDIMGDSRLAWMDADFFGLWCGREQGGHRSLLPGIRVDSGGRGNKGFRRPEA